MARILDRLLAGASSRRRFLARAFPSRPAPLEAQDLAVIRQWSYLWRDAAAGVNG